MSYNVHTEFVENMQLSMTSKSFTLEIIVVAKLEKQSVLTTLERPPEEEKELHEYISAFIVHAIITFLTFTGMFLRDKKQKTSCPKKKKTGQKY